MKKLIGNGWFVAHCCVKGRVTHSACLGWNKRAFKLSQYFEIWINVTVHVTVSPRWLPGRFSLWFANAAGSALFVIVPLSCFRGQRSVPVWEKDVVVTNWRKTTRNCVRKALTYHMLSKQPEAGHWFFRSVERRCTDEAVGVSIIAIETAVHCIWSYDVS